MKYIKLFENFDKKLIVYHGSESEHDFNTHGNIYYGTFFSTDISTARDFGNVIYKMELMDNLNLFDTNNFGDCKILFKNFDCLYDTYYSEDENGYYIKNPKSFSNFTDTWEPIEKTDGVLDWLKSNYDGVWIYEGGIQNLLLFKPVKDKIKNINLVKKFNEMVNNYNYDYIIKTLVRENGWGNTISDLMPDFEKSEFFNPVIDNDSYIIQFNDYLRNNGSSQHQDRQNITTAEPISWYGKST